MHRPTTRRPARGRSRSGRFSRRPTGKGGLGKPRGPRPSLAVPWIDATQGHLERFADATIAATKTVEPDAVRDARLESRTLYEALEGLRPWIHAGRFARTHRLVRKVRRILSPVREKDRLIQMIQRLVGESRWAPLEGLLSELIEQRAQAAEKAKKKLAGVRTARLRTDLTATLTDLHASPPQSRSLASHLAPSMARRRDRFIEALALSVQEGPGHGARLLIDERKLRHTVELLGTLPSIDAREALEALDIVGRYLEEWWDAGLLETLLAAKVEQLSGSRGKKKELTRLKALLEEVREGRVDYMERAWLSVDSTGLRKALRELVRVAVREAQPPRPHWR
ncbi:MAG: CHAD domain-containing protein [Planctomycetota bacterium]